MFFVDGLLKRLGRLGSKVLEAQLLGLAIALALDVVLTGGLVAFEARWIVLLVHLHLESLQLLLADFLRCLTCTHDGNLTFRVAIYAVCNKCS